MSKRPKSANSFMSRLRRPVGRLRDLPIWSKLGLIMIVPTLATVVVGTNGLIDHLDTASKASRARDLAGLAEASGGLVHGLQDERAAAVLVLGTRDPQARQRYLQSYSKLHSNVDEAKKPYSQRRTPLTDLPINFRNLLTRIDQNLADLPGTRSQVVNSKLPLTEASLAYEGLINDLLDLRDSAAQLSGDAALSERMRAAAATARTKEFLSMRRVVVLRALIDGHLTPVLHTEYIATETGQQQALQSFKAVANRGESEFYDQTVSGSDQRETEFYSGYLKAKTTESMQDAPFDVGKWDSAMIGNAKLIRAVEAKLDSDVVKQATALRDSVRRQVYIETGVLLGMLLLAILFAWLVARSMARSLRELRHGALSIAQYGLPQAVARLRDPQLSAQMSPVQVANHIADPLPVRSKDEFGQVTEAFNAVHLEAVRTAAEQAALRSSVATMFVNLARRSQILVDRLIGHLDRLERGEEDPDRLAELFQLDHLATRMRRNDENLLVLAGADSTRVQREPAALIDVLRAAQSEVEHYTRIEFGVIDRDIEVAAHAVNDMVHLLAELFDNATSFSPPDSQILVEARRVGDRAVLYVQDRGIGISQDQLHDLNERLATPPQVDVAVSRMMGLVVVARLAARHGVRVELRPGADRGTVAEVTLPTAVLVPRALSGRLQPGSFETQAPQSPAQRPALGVPLALESGPAGARRDERTTRSGPGGRSFDPVPLNGGGLLNPAASSRAMPAWSDLTGATTGVNGADAFTPRPPNGHPADPLPQRRATDQWTVDGEVTGSGPLPNSPNRVPDSLESEPNSAGLPGLPPVSGLPMGSTPPVSSPPVASAPPVSSPPLAPAPQPTVPFAAPPAWPPVAAPERDAATPPVPEKLAAALDMTAELPRVTRPTAETPVTAPPAAEPRPRFSDETMELPIFRELESAWFRTRRSAQEEVTASASSHRPADPAASAPAAHYATVDAGRGAGAAAQNTSTGATGNAAMMNSPMPADWSREAGPGVSSRGVPAGDGAVRRSDAPAGWETAADAGWRAATAASETPVAETTQTGLPKRVPMAQLVPGGVDKPSSSVQRRTPEAVRGLLSAYHRGVQRGRTTHPKDDHSTSQGPTPNGPQSQAGSSPAAGNGQKEQEG